MRPRRPSRETSGLAEARAVGTAARRTGPAGSVSPPLGPPFKALATRARGKPLLAFSKPPRNRRGVPRYWPCCNAPAAPLGAEPAVARCRSPRSRHERSSAPCRSLPVDGRQGFPGLLEARAPVPGEPAGSKDVARRIRGVQQTIADFESDRARATLPDRLTDRAARSWSLQLLERSFEDERMHGTGMTPARRRCSRASARRPACVRAPRLLRRSEARRARAPATLRE
jgi:hypothetical protein